MQTKQIVTRLIEESFPTMHLARRQALRDVCLAATSGHWLSLSTLAGGTQRATTLRHRVKCVDRLLVNRHLHEARGPLYAALAQRWLGALQKSKVPGSNLIEFVPNPALS